MKESFRRLQERTGVKFANTALLRQAFTHTSYVNERKAPGISDNERLEFLGDAVLGSVVADVLFKMYPYEDEGFLTELRSKMVSRINLNALGRKLGFE